MNWPYVGSSTLGKRSAVPRLGMLYHPWHFPKTHTLIWIFQDEHRKIIKTCSPARHKSWSAGTNKATHATSISATARTASLVREAASRAWPSTLSTAEPRSSCEANQHNQATMRLPVVLGRRKKHQESNSRISSPVAISQRSPSWVWTSSIAFCRRCVHGSEWGEPACIFGKWQKCGSRFWKATTFSWKKKVPVPCWMVCALEFSHCSYLYVELLISWTRRKLSHVSFPKWFVNNWMTQ